MKTNEDTGMELKNVDVPEQDKQRKLDEWKKQLDMIVELGKAYALEWMWRVEWK